MLPPDTVQLMTALTVYTTWIGRGKMMGSWHLSKVHEAPLGAGKFDGQGEAVS